MDEEALILQTLTRYTPGSIILKEYHHGTISYRVESIHVTLYNECILVCWQSDGRFVYDMAHLSATLRMALIYGALDDFCHTHRAFKWFTANVQGLEHICIASRWVKLRVYLRVEEESGLCGIVFFERFYFAVTRSPRHLRPRLLVSSTWDLFLFIKTILLEPHSLPDWSSLLTMPLLPWSHARREWGSMLLDGV